MHSLHHDERDHVSLDLYKAVALWQQLVVTKERANIVRLTTVEEFDKQSAPGQPLEPLAKRLLEIDDFQHMEIDDSNTWQTIVSSTQSGLPSSDRNPDPLICHKHKSSACNGKLELPFAGIASGSGIYLLQ